MIDFLYLFSLFLMYSLLGYILECSFVSIKNKKIVLNRGFLIGPYLPIYGIGGLLIVFLLKKYLNDSIALCVMSTVICSILEYFTSYIMEKIFNARWWDYSKNKYNINGRVCLLNSFLFGIVGLLIMYFVNPFFIKIIKFINETVFIIFFSIILILFIVDVIVSIYITYRLRCDANIIKKEITNELSNHVNKIINRNRFFKLRILNAYPRLRDNMNYKNIKDLLDKINVKK